MLEIGDGPVEAVAADVGYQDASFFGRLLPQGEPPALPGWLSEFNISGSMFFAVWARIVCVCAAALFLHHGRLRKGPFEGPATVKPPALPEDIYCRSRHRSD